MGRRISNEVIVERIEGVKEHVSLKFDALEKKFDTWKEDVEPEIKDNTKFRQNAKGIFAAISLMGMFLGGLAVEGYNKIKFW